MDYLGHFRRVDPVMAALARRVGPFAISRQRGTPFQALMRSIVFQQLNGKAAETILERLIRECPGGRWPLPEALLAIPLTRLRAAGLSGQKAAYLRDLARHAIAGTVPDRRRLLRLTDEAIIDRLTEVKGIGRWSVEMLLMFNLGRPDVLPVDDYGVRKGYAQVYGKRGLPKPRALAEYGERWRPFRTAAAWYLWRSLEL